MARQMAPIVDDGVFAHTKNMPFPTAKSMNAMDVMRYIVCLPRSASNAVAVDWQSFEEKISHLFWRVISIYQNLYKIIDLESKIHIIWKGLYELDISNIL